MAPIALSHGDGAPGAGVEDCITSAHRFWQAICVVHVFVCLVHVFVCVVHVFVCVVRVCVFICAVHVFTCVVHVHVYVYVYVLCVRRTASPAHADFGGLYV